MKFRLGLNFLRVPPTLLSVQAKMDALGLAYALRELRAWSKAGKTGAIRVKFVGGQINSVRWFDAIGLAHLPGIDG